jgi:hypothetical protein
MKSPTTHNSTSSPASADGPSLSDSQAGPMTDLFGLEAAPASRSRKLAKANAKPTKGTSGPSSATSSPSAILQSRLASKLRARLAAHGSLEFALTWKDWDMLSGPPICALRASTPRTSGNACSGWPTPDTNQRGGAQDPAKRKAGGHSVNLQDAALLAGWPTPTSSMVTEQNMAQAMTAGTPAQNGNNAAGNNDSSRKTVDLSGWHTPVVRDCRNSPGDGSNPRNLPRQAALGMTSTSSPAPTEKRGALNPAHSRWLMGYPARMVRLRGYGNAIVPQVAAEFIKAFLEVA